MEEVVSATTFMQSYASTIMSSSVEVVEYSMEAGSGFHDLPRDPTSLQELPCWHEIPRAFAEMVVVLFCGLGSRWLTTPTLTTPNPNPKPIIGWLGWSVMGKTLQ